MARKKKRAQGEPRAAAPRDGAVYINLPGKELARLRLGERRSLQRKAIHWTYALRNRQRWNTLQDASARQRQDMHELAIALGLTTEHFRAIAASGLVEVDIPWSSEAQDWELRILPWEYMLAAATREFRGSQPFTVVRRLRVAGRPAPKSAPASWLQVLSAPGALGTEYDFTGEHKLLALSVKSVAGKLHVLKDPERSMLEGRIISQAPDVIHLSGFDIHQGMSLLGREADAAIQDGYLLRAGDGSPDAVDSESLARILTAAKGRGPKLISCNVFNSAARTAPLCVAHGAGAAIGFQDSFDDQLAELFFTTLYQAWHLADWNIAPAFQYAWQAVRQQNKPLQGSGIVLWSARSILDAAPRQEGAQADAGQARIAARWRSKVKKPGKPEEVRDQLEVELAVIPQLNYSILHNNGPIFERFRVRKKSLSIGRVDGLLVNVELHVGTDTYPFRVQASIDETASHLDLPQAIRLSLASALTRTIRESIHTSLFVEVTWNGATLYRQTHRVTLLPVDEWRFDKNNYKWLPSFVLPRDPAVLRVVDSAQRYLMALRDDATAGFDGYQCVEVKAGERPTPEDCALVDMQVRAIWSALLYESPLSYINPPPSFTDSSQRLRTPSDCLDGKRGTCIDLALLLAACLEYVEIYPTMVLLKTHAFPAYWRHDSYHADFIDLKRATQEGNGSGSAAVSAPATAPGWDAQPSQYREIIGEVQAGRLVPLETTLVTGRGSFADAIAGGVQNLASRREFEAMLDILRARWASVTPLPLRRGEL